MTTPTNTPTLSPLSSAHASKLLDSSFRLPLTPREKVKSHYGPHRLTRKKTIAPYTFLEDKITSEHFWLLQQLSGKSHSSSSVSLLRFSADDEEADVDALRSNPSESEMPSARHSNKDLPPGSANSSSDTREAAWSVASKNSRQTRASSALISGKDKIRCTGDESDIRQVVLFLATTVTGSA